MTAEHEKDIETVGSDSVPDSTSGTEVDTGANTEAEVVSVCRECNEKLVVNYNWYEAYAAIGNRLCVDCSREYGRARYARKKAEGTLHAPLTPEEIAEHDHRENVAWMEKRNRCLGPFYCTLCGVELVCPDNWQTSRRNRLEKICRDCARERAKGYRHNRRCRRRKASYADRYCKTCGELLRHPTRMDDSFTERQKSNAASGWWRNECIECRLIKANIAKYRGGLNPHSAMYMYLVEGVIFDEASREKAEQPARTDLAAFEARLAHRIAGKDARLTAAKARTLTDRMDLESMVADYKAGCTRPGPGPGFKPWIDDDVEPEVEVEPEAKTTTEAETAAATPVAVQDPKDILKANLDAFFSEEPVIDIDKL